MLNEYFESQKDKLSYLELKIPLELGGQRIETEKVPLPIETEKLLAHIQNSKNNENISLAFFLRGMMINFAIHQDFSYQKNYREIIYAWSEKPEEWFFKNALENLGKDEALLMFRGLFYFNPDFMINRIFYAKALFMKAFQFSEDKHSEWIEESIAILEKTLDVDENNIMTLSTLGDIFSTTGFYSKADVYYQKALKQNPEMLFAEEIRKKRLDMEKDLALEKSRLEMDTGRYEEALETLLNALKNKRDAELCYWVGVCYQGLGSLEESIPFFEETLEKIPNHLEATNDLCISLYLLGKIDSALRILGEAIRRYPKDARLKYNLMVLLYQNENPKRGNELLHELLHMKEKGEIEYPDIIEAVEQFNYEMQK